MDGYIEYHKTICAKNDCPSKKVISGGSSRLFKSIKDENNQEVIRILLLIESTIIFGLQKFPNSPKLRIHHSLYLLDKMNQKQHALSELINAESERTSLVEEFLIFRMK